MNTCTAWRATTGATALAVALVAGAMSHSALAQGVYAYPRAGQSQEQQQRDEFECHRWATGQTGYDPRNPPPAPQSYASSPPPPSSSSGGLFGYGSEDVGQGGVVMDAGRGALTGAVIGGIAGDAGKGAAFGALGGTMMGGIRRNQRQQEQARWEQYQRQQYAQQQQAHANQRRAAENEYRRAFGACMQGRDYQVQ